MAICDNNEYSLIATDEVFVTSKNNDNPLKISFIDEVTDESISSVTYLNDE